MNCGKMLGCEILSKRLQSAARFVATAGIMAAFAAVPFFALNTHAQNTGAQKAATANSAAQRIRCATTRRSKGQCSQKCGQRSGGAADREAAAETLVSSGKQHRAEDSG